MSKVFDLAGKTAIITGGGSGIGAAISEVFARQGADTHILELKAENAAAVQEKIEQEGGKVTVHACDVSSQTAVNETFQAIFEATGKLNILINNAGIAHVGNVENTTEEDFDRIYAVNIKGVYNCLKAGIGYMKQSGGGAIINMASIASVIGVADRFAYSTSKGAVYTMTVSIAKDYLADNIRCNSIGPARVHTPFVDGFLKKNYPGQEQEMFDKLSKTQPIGRMGKPEEIAHLALYLSSDEASFITGSFYPIDGGFITLNG